jgi:uncharacterized protein YbaP (TraB family)
MQRKKTMAALVLSLFFLVTGFAQAEPSLWVVKGPHATVYLFGSVHALKKDQPWRSPKIDAAIHSSGSLWLEIPNVDDAQAMQPLLLQLGIDAAHPLSSKLTPEQLAKLEAAAKGAGLPGGEASLEVMKPWLAAVMLATFPMLQAGYDPSSGVELVLKPEFVQAGKPVKGFETAEQQLHYFADMPEKAQIDYLASELDDFDKASENFNKIVAAWYAGDDKLLDHMMSADLRDKLPDLYQTLIVKRNQGFVAQIQDLLKGDGTVFVAVGAGHLVGSDGVPAILEKLGYKVVRQ